MPKQRGAVVPEFGNASPVYSQDRRDEPPLVFSSSSSDGAFKLVERDAHFVVAVFTFRETRARVARHRAGRASPLRHAEAADRSAAVTFAKASVAVAAAPMRASSIPQVTVAAGAFAQIRVSVVESGDAHLARQIAAAFDRASVTTVVDRHGAKRGEPVRIVFARVRFVADVHERRLEHPHDRRTT